MPRRFLERGATLLLTLLAGCFLAATLVRVAPGFGVDERLLDPRLSEASRQAIRNSYAAETSLPRYYARYLNAVLHGDMGVSLQFDRPVMDLIKERATPTLRAIVFALVLAWISGLGVAIFVALVKNSFLEWSATLLTALCLSLPSAAVAVLLLVWQQPVPLAISFLLFPKIYRYSRNLLRDSYGELHVLTAYAKGLAPWRVMAWHVLPRIMPQLAALFGATVSLALTASIPIEAVGDVPGLGQLAWQAALGRDLPLLLGVTLLITAVTVVVNNAAELLQPKQIAVRPI